MEDKRTEQYRQELKEFVMSHTEDVLKNPRSFIRYPFIDPGSVYDGNVWDWDTYWSVYGFLNLADSYQDPSVKPRIIEHAQGNIRNFFDLCTVYSWHFVSTISSLVFTVESGLALNILNSFLIVQCSEQHCATHL